MLLCSNTEYSNQVLYSNRMLPPKAFVSDIYKPLFLSVPVAHSNKHIFACSLNQ